MTDILLPPAVSLLVIALLLWFTVKALWEDT
jgi:hypothetical protein